MKLVASDYYTYFRPSLCGLRVYFRHRGEPEAEPGPYEVVIRRLAERHERRHLTTFAEVVDLSEVPRAEREARTRDAVVAQVPVIYQAVLRATALVRGVEVEVVGEPDFLIWSGNGHCIRDSKMAKRINEKDHPEIFRQLQLYGWLYERAFQHAPVGLEIHSGPGDIVPIPYDGGGKALEYLELIAGLKQAAEEPESPVGWTKCGGCGFRGRCWPRAEQNQDLALVAGIDQGLAMALYAQGIRTVDELLGQFDEARLAEVQRQWGKSTRRVGNAAPRILRMAQALASGKEVWLATPELPGHRNFAMFDLEGLPPQLDELEKVYLWGLQVYGERLGPYRGATGGFGVDGDCQGWLEFLGVAREIFEDYGDIPFVHWHHYERVRLDLYIDRFGDVDGTAVRVRRNLLDLYPIVQNAAALPLSSYSLKAVEEYVGFRRTQDEYGGEWAMAKYIEATETEDTVQREKLVSEILIYNREDLAATWAVFDWLRRRA